MAKDYKIDAQWDDEARVCVATSLDAPGVVAEAPFRAQMIDEARSAPPDLLEVEDDAAWRMSPTFKVETHVDRASR